MLTLTLRNPPAGAPPVLTIDRRDAMIGRATGLDWSLPDPQISSRHCQIGFRDGVYLLRDTSTNGTFINGARLAGLHRLAERDVIGVGALEIAVSLSSGAPAAPAPHTAAPAAGPATIEAALAAALATLLATRRRQLAELGATLPDGLAQHPLAVGASDAAARLKALPQAEAIAAIEAAGTAIERHHAASLRAMQAALRTALADLDPAAIEASADIARLSGDARDAAAWRAYRTRFDGEKLAGKGFVETFARSFREAYEALAR